MSEDQRQDLELVDYLCVAQNRPDDLAARMALADYDAVLKHEPSRDLLKKITAK